MALEGPAKLYKWERSRTLLYVSAKVAGDSAFPFRPSDKLTVRIEKGKLVVEKEK